MEDSNAPYWLLKIDGEKHGFATVGLWEAQSSRIALNVWWAREAESARALGIDRNTVTATLVTLSYVDGQPVVTAVS